MNREIARTECFNAAAGLPYELLIKDFELAIQDIYDFFHDVNSTLGRKGLGRFDDILRPAAMTGIISDMLTASLAKHSRSLVQNTYHNGHPDLVVRGLHPKDSAKAADSGVEIKATRKTGGAVDTHGARDQWMCVFVYRVDNATEPTGARYPMQFTEIYLAKVMKSDFRKNERGELGTRTATLDREGVKKLRAQWIYLLTDPAI